jgi:putative phosphoribosyl transferase
MPAREAYADRAAAGRALAAELADLHGRDDVVVLGLPRGGVPVAAEVARALGVPLDVVVVRKLGLPAQPELAMGAVAGVGRTVELVRNDEVLRGSRVDDATLAQVREREVVELHRREETYRGRRSGVAVRGRTVVLVDDGLATGSSMRAAIAAVRHQHPAHVVVAVPVGAADTCTALAAEVDRVVCAWIPAAFMAVGQAYVRFDQTTDDEVREALAAVREEAPREQ